MYTEIDEDNLVPVSRIREWAKVICEANDLPMVTIIDCDNWMVNLESLQPNGYCNAHSGVYINLDARVLGEDTVLPILAHEIAHNSLNHLSYTMYNHWSLNMLVCKEEVPLSRFKELEADRLGHRYLVKAGFSEYLTLGLMIKYLKDWLEEVYIDRPKGTAKYKLKRMKGSPGYTYNKRHPLRDSYENQRNRILHFEHYLKRSNFYKDYLMRKESHPHPLERIDNILKEL